jgi:hypothetical protein
MTDEEKSVAEATERTPYVVKSRTLRTESACEPLRRMLGAADRAKPKAWTAVEDGFLRAMEAFDTEVAAGDAGQGAQRNGKGEFFNDLLAMLLGNCARVDLVTRPGVPGLIFPTHNLDATYPPGEDVVIEFLLEAKTAGTPKHPGNKKQKNKMGRPGRSDLPKRIKETGFKTIDLKAEYGRIMAAHGESPGGGPSGDVTTWLRAQKPISCLFLAVRVVDDNDLAATIQLANQATLVQDAVGLFCFPRPAPRSSRPMPHGRCRPT